MSTAYPSPGGYGPPQPGGPTAPTAGHFPSPTDYGSSPAAERPPATQQLDGQQQGPSGLELMTTTDQLHVKLSTESFAAFTGFEANIKYVVQNSMGQNVYFAVEESGDCARYCWGSSRTFDMKIFDHSQNEVIHLYRPMAYNQSIDIFAPEGQLIGRVKERCNICSPSFSILNESGVEVLKLKGPCCTCTGMGLNATFKVLTLDGKTEIGKITKQKTQGSRNASSYANSFGITFPLDLDIKMKAVLLGALFLIDFMFFESPTSECEQDFYFCARGFNSVT